MDYISSIISTVSVGISVVTLVRSSKREKQQQSELTRKVAAALLHRLDGIIWDFEDWRERNEQRFISKKLDKGIPDDLLIKSLPDDAVGLLYYVWGYFEDLQYNWPGKDGRDFKEIEMINGVSIKEDISNLKQILERISHT